MNHNFTFREGTWDNAIFNCINQHNEYKLPDSMEGKVVVDIGAHIGSFGYACLSRGAKKVYAFEAFKDNFELTQKNLSQFGDRAEVFHKAVWRSDQPNTTLTFSESNDEINTGGGNVWSASGSETVSTISLDQIVSMVGPIDFLKLDCEGSEFPILFTCTMIDKIKEMAGEYHEFQGEYDQNVIPDHMKIDGYDKFTVAELTKFLSKHGFLGSADRAKSQGKSVNLGHFFATR